MKRRAVTGAREPRGARVPEDDDARRQRILATVDSIPPGSVATYGQVADEAGLPRRARLVGKILGTLPARTTVPWWRVVGASGAISPRGDGESMSVQRRRLEREGVPFRANVTRVDLAVSRWDGVRVRAFILD
ncbi:MAG: MGMT family protein [Planctomycetota bacterium]